MEEKYLELKLGQSRLAYGVRSSAASDIRLLVDQRPNSARLFPHLKKFFIFNATVLKRQAFGLNCGKWQLKFAIVNLLDLIQNLNFRCTLVFTRGINGSQVAKRIPDSGIQKLSRRILTVMCMFAI